LRRRTKGTDQKSPQSLVFTGFVALLEVFATIHERVLLRIVEENHQKRTVPEEHPLGVYMRDDFGAIKSQKYRK
jgi:hypothetical protein